MQEQEFQPNVIDAVVLVLLSIAGADHRKNMEAACGTLPKAVSNLWLFGVQRLRLCRDIQCASDFLMCYSTLAGEECPFISLTVQPGRSIRQLQTALQGLYSMPV